MSDIQPSAGRFERWFLSIPDGAILRAVFLGVLALGASVLAQDVMRISSKGEDAARLQRTEPMPLARPVPGDQIRPYLPRTIPVGPDRGEPTIPGYEGPLDTQAMTRSMAFRRTEGDTVSAVGRIDVGTADDLKRFLDGEGKGAKRLVLHSPGGSVVDAIAMARLLRERGVDTAVPADGYCASACPLVLAGGVSRAAGEQAWVGLHQVYAVEIPGSAVMRDVDRSISDIQATIADCQQLLVDMGVDPRVWIHAMQTPPEELYVLTPDELTTSKMVFTAPAVPPAS